MSLLTTDLQKAGDPLSPFPTDSGLSSADYLTSAELPLCHPYHIGTYSRSIFPPDHHFRHCDITGLSLDAHPPGFGAKTTKMSTKGIKKKQPTPRDLYV